MLRTLPLQAWQGPSGFQLSESSAHTRTSGSSRTREQPVSLRQPLCDWPTSRMCRTIHFPQVENDFACSVGEGSCELSSLSFYRMRPEEWNLNFLFSDFTADKVKKTIVSPSWCQNWDSLMELTFMCGRIVCSPLWFWLTPCLDPFSWLPEGLVLGLSTKA